jgi:hypothetical protein
MSKKIRVQLIESDGSPFLAKGQGRNSLCSCGSGRKAKRCCGTETKYYSTKKVKESAHDRYLRDKEKIKDL